MPCEFILAYASHSFLPPSHIPSNNSNLFTNHHLFFSLFFLLFAVFCHFAIFSSSASFLSPLFYFFILSPPPPVFRLPRFLPPTFLNPSHRRFPPLFSLFAPYLTPRFEPLQRATSPIFHLLHFSPPQFSTLHVSQPPSFSNSSPGSASVPSPPFPAVFHLTLCDKRHRRPYFLFCAVYP